MFRTGLCPSLQTPRSTRSLTRSGNVSAHGESPKDDCEPREDAMNRRECLGWIAFTPLAAKPLIQALAAVASPIEQMTLYSDTLTLDQTRNTVRRTVAPV